MTSAAGLQSAPVGNASSGRATREAMGMSAIPSLRICEWPRPRTCKIWSSRNIGMICSDYFCCMCPKEGIFFFRFLFLKNKTKTLSAQNMAMQRPPLSEHGPITLDERAGPRADGARSSGGEDSRAAAGGDERAPGLAGMECVPADGFWCFALERRGIRLSSWTLLTIFIYCNLLNYVDRGLVNGMLPQYCVNCQTRTDAQGCRAMASCEWRAGNATGNATCAFNASVLPRLGIGGSLKIKETAQGVIAGSFMGGYCVFSPIFAYLSTLYKPFNLMGLGLSAWCIACALATVAPSFGTPETLCHRSHMRIQAHAGQSLSLTHAQTHAKLRSDAHARTRTHRDLNCCAGGVGDWRGELPMHWCTQSQKYST